MYIYTEGESRNPGSPKQHKFKNKIISITKTSFCNAYGYAKDISE